MGTPPVPILYEDSHLVAVDKPSGLLVHRSAWSGGEGGTLAELVSDHLGGAAHPVHRLDRGTSGVLVLARTPEAARAMQALFAEGRIAKRYLALVRGTPPADVVVDHPVPRREGGGAERAPAVTRVERLATTTLADSPLREKTYALVRATPRTGRFHQVRRHLKHLGHPVLGDANYGRAEHNKLVRERFDLGRLALHAEALDLIHPITGEALALAAPLPESLSIPMMRMGLVSVT